MNSTIYHCDEDYVSKVWEVKLAWDEEIPQTFQEQHLSWRKQHLSWRKQLPLLASKRLPRCYFLSNQSQTSVELHGFSDASEKAYTAVVYVRTTYYSNATKFL